MMLPKLTSLSLSLWIAGVILFQLLIFSAYGFYRHWMSYLRLREQVESGTVPLEVTPPQTKAPLAWKGLRSFVITQKTHEDAAQGIASFYLEPEDKQPLPPYRPGQFLTFELPLEDGEVINRCYSLSDASQPHHYRCSIKRVQGGKSSTHFHDRLAVGSRIKLRAPSGGFYLQDGQGPIVLIGGGIGITPMLAMANGALAQQANREVWLFYGVKTVDEAMMLPHFRALAAKHPGFRFMLCVSHGDVPQDAGDMRRGRITLDLLRLTLPLRPFEFYICGPTAMMESLVHGLEEWGVPDARIHFEAFGPSTITRKTAPVPHHSEEPAFDISFVRSGKTVPWDSGKASLLDLAEAHGVTLQSSCRSGSCGTCQTRITAGTVHYDGAPAFEPEEGHCLPCACRPTSPVTLEA